MPTPQRLTAGHHVGFSVLTKDAQALLEQLQQLASQEADLQQQALAVADQAIALKDQLGRHVNTTQAQLELAQDQGFATEIHQTLARALQQLAHVAGQQRHNTTIGLHNADLSSAAREIAYVEAQLAARATPEAAALEQAYQKASAQVLAQLTQPQEATSNG